METLAKLAFLFYALVILAGGWWAVSAASLVRALIGLIAALFGVAGMYLLLNAPFVAFMQILIYVGAVSVLVFLAIMLVRASAEGEEAEPKPMRYYVTALIGLLTPAVLLGWIVMTHPAKSIMDKPLEVEAKVLGQGLMEPYILAFELISLVLLVAMSGAVVLAFEKRAKSEVEK